MFRLRLEEVGPEKDSNKFFSATIPERIWIAVPLLTLFADKAAAGRNHSASGMDDARTTVGGMPIGFPCSVAAPLDVISPRWQVRETQATVFTAVVL